MRIECTVLTKWDGSPKFTSPKLIIFFHFVYFNPIVMKRELIQRNMARTIDGKSQNPTELNQDKEGTNQITAVTYSYSNSYSERRLNIPELKRNIPRTNIPLDQLVLRLLSVLFIPVQCSHSVHCGCHTFFIKF